MPGQTYNQKKGKNRSHCKSYEARAGTLGGSKGGGSGIVGQEQMLDPRRAFLFIGGLNRIMGLAKEG